MDPFDECSVLIPSATLEDFPTGGSDEDARGLLAGWTVLWHPMLLAQTEQLPTWYRADAPPTPDGPRVVVVPKCSEEMLPSDFRRRCDSNPSCLWVDGNDRAEMCAQLGLDGDGESQEIEFSGRKLSVDDFFAAGYLSLQIQIMTRRLRYTSNIDEIYLQKRIVAAAQAFLKGEADSAAEGLHDVFDCLAEERDHYFSSDPHLLDLNLLTPSVLQKALASDWPKELESRQPNDDESNGVLRQPTNVLIDGDVAAYLRDQSDHSTEHFCELIRNEKIGWAGGGPEDANADSCLDALTASKAFSLFGSGTQLALDSLGIQPTVYGRLAGMTPSDLIPKLAHLGYRGVIPIDFVEGTGFGEESKVIASSGGCEIEALTAKPIDAASDRAFLSMGATLGEAIDGGEVATGLMVHWPNQVCDSYRDLTRAASWCVALGRFWTLQSYFKDGERPYHNGNLKTLSKQAAATLAQKLSQKDASESLESMASEFCAEVRSESNRTTFGLLAIGSPNLIDLPKDELDPHSPDNAPLISIIGRGIGLDPEKLLSTDAPVKHLAEFNPHGVGFRSQAMLDGGGPTESKFVYAATRESDNTVATTFDLPAMGFTRLSATKTPSGPGLFKRLFRKDKGIAEDAVLRNQFMAASLSPEGGGIAGIYSATRGNRLSMKLVAVSGGKPSEAASEMVTDEIRTVRSDKAVGEIEAMGKLKDETGETLADFRILYRLERGSRALEIRGSITPKKRTVSDDDPNGCTSLSKDYFAIRTAVASEAPTWRAIVRDKLHRTDTKFFIAPAGVLIDETEKQTLVCSHGLPLHRIAGDRFLDTLIASTHTDGEEIRFELSYLLDCPNPVASARAQIAPPIKISSNDASIKPGTNQAWLAHVSAKDVLITDIQTKRRADGLLATQFLLTQTRPRTSNVRLDFCAHVKFAFISDANGIERSLDDLPGDVVCNDGAVEVTIDSHQVLEMVAVFDI